MAVSYEGYDAKTLQLLRTMLSESARFQTWCGAMDATEALDFIVESDAGTRVATARPFALLYVDEPDSPDEIGLHTYAHRNEIAIELVKDITDGDTDAEAIRRAWGDASTIAQELRAQLGAADKLNRAAIRLEEPQRGAETSDEKNAIGTMIRVETFTR